MNSKALLTAVFVAGTVTGAGTVKLVGTGKPVELELRWQNDHAWATGRLFPDAGQEVAVRRCTIAVEPLDDGGQRLTDLPCTEHVLDAGETGCWNAWLKCSQ